MISAKHKEQRQALPCANSLWRMGICVALFAKLISLGNTLTTASVYLEKRTRITPLRLGRLNF
eukprot:2414498-Ditylum_brightwellii.AAC.1